MSEFVAGRWYVCQLHGVSTEKQCECVTPVGDRYGARPPREHYVRASFIFGNVSFEPAVEWRVGDSFYDLVGAMRTLVTRIPSELTDPMERALWFGDQAAARWPDRAYFVEIYQAGTEGYVQVFQPYGLPRNR